MSAQAVGAAAAGAEISPGAIAVSQRIEQLQSMIAKAQEGPASFAAALETAVSGTSGASASPASTASTSSYPAGGELEPSHFRGGSERRALRLADRPGCSGKRA